MENLIINDLEIEVIRKDIKHVNLSVCPPIGKVRIVAPTHTSEEFIKLFAISKIPWIKKKKTSFENQERISPRAYVNRESHYFQGQRYLLYIIEVEAAPKVIIKNRTKIEMYIRPNTSVEKRHEIMSEWYRKQLKLILPDIITKWENIIGVKISEFQIKQMKTLWGTCNVEKKRIWINLELAKKPQPCLEYIVVHELVHLLENTHNERFQFLMSKYLPNWQTLKSDLNRLPASHADWQY